MMLNGDLPATSHGKVLQGVLAPIHDFPKEKQTGDGSPIESQRGNSMFDRESGKEPVQVVNGSQAIGIEGRVLQDG